MKKLKLLPTILMLVLCFGVLAIGVYAIQPSKNTISGTITVNASNAEVKLELFRGNETTPIQTLESVRGGDDFEELALSFNTENANTADDVEDLVYRVRITNKSSKHLAAYFFKPGTESKLNEDLSEGVEKIGKDYAKLENILTTDEIFDKTTTTDKICDVSLSDYSYIAPANEDNDLYVVEMKVTMSLFELYNDEKTNDFDYTINIEEYVGNSGILQAGTSSEVKNTFGGTFLKISTDNTSIPAYAYKDNSTVVKMVIPNTVTSIDNNAFNSCTALTEIKIPNSITTLGTEVFTGCTALKNVVFEYGFSGKVTRDIFGGCTALESIWMPNTAKRDWTYLTDGPSYKLVCFGVNDEIFAIYEYKNEKNNIVICGDMTQSSAYWSGFWVHHKNSEYIIEADVTRVDYSCMASFTNNMIIVKKGSTDLVGYLPHDFEVMGGSATFSLNGAGTLKTGDAITRSATEDNIYVQTGVVYE